MGESGAVPPKATVRVTNLDSTAGAVATTADAQGAFLLTVSAESGDELRFQAVLDGQRSAPVDLIYTLTDSALRELSPSPRHACVSLSPGFELSFDTPGAESLLFSNACSQPLTLSNPRQRLGLEDFVLVTPLPLVVDDAASATADVEFSPTAAAEREDVLFLDLAAGDSVFRYPITLIAP
jgi:hypothetical protein